MTKNKTDRRGGQPADGKFGTGNQPHEFSDALARQIMQMAGLQLSQKEIGAVLEISEDTIQRHYHNHWRKGKEQAGVGLRSSAFQMARGVLNDPDKPENGYKIPPDRAMIMFLLKTQFGFKESSKHEIISKGGPSENGHSASETLHSRLNKIGGHDA